MEAVITKTQPTEGQFVCFWENNGRLWSNTYKYFNGNLYIYDSSDDFWNDGDVAVFDRDCRFVVVKDDSHENLPSTTSKRSASNT